MPKASKQLTDARREEIINACKELYKTMSFKDITIKDIGNKVSFTRTSIYNYFQTKEEIFLAILQQEYEMWLKSLNSILNDNSTLSKDELAKLLAKSLEERELLLKLMSMNNYDMEENSRIERLTQFKEVYGKCILALENCFKKFTSLTEAKRREVLYSFLPFVYGIYPYAKVTPKQSEAMKNAGVKFRYHTIYDLSLICLKNLLN